MKIKRRLFLFFIISACFLKAQNEHAFSILEERGEVRFSFYEKNREIIGSLSNSLSIDKIDTDGKIYAYANKKEFADFLKLGYTYEIIPKEKTAGTKSILTASSIEEMQYWNRYPTYGVYLKLMQSFEQKYPELCRIDTIGYSVKNRLILAARISSNGGTKPEFFYSSTMHGDEVTGFVLMLRLIHYLLSNYGEDEKITHLINSVDVYINPNSNPDGTYFLSDDNISGAKRYNANNEDLNRNYPDPFHPENIILQKENKEMIQYVKDHHFTMSANIHGGTEILNFPWDSYDSSEKRPVDSLWWVQISKQFVDTCRNFSENSFTDIFFSGITYGGDWYKVSGGRQDFMNASLKVRELTMEISASKILPVDSLNFFWEMQYKSFSNYIKQASYGICGKVRDSLTRMPVKAKIWIERHDNDESFIYSSPDGYFYRPIFSGTYDLTFSADGYISKTIKEISPADFSSVFLSVELNKTGKTEKFKIYPNPAKDYVAIESHENIKSVVLYDLSGKRFANIQNIGRQSYSLGTKFLCSGIYVLSITTEIEIRNQKIIILN